VAHPRLMWSYDSANHRNLRGRSVVKRTMREGMGLEEEDSRLELSDFAVEVAPKEDLAPIEALVPDLKASIDGLSVTMAETLHVQSRVLPDTRGCEVVLGPSKVSVVLSDGDSSGMLKADLLENHSPASVDGEEIQDTVTGPDAALPSPCLLVSVPSSPRGAGLLVADAEDRGGEAVQGLSPAVSSGGQAMGDGLAGKIIGGLDDSLVADSEGESVSPVPIELCLPFFKSC
ncbi:hypothetical protein Dimus_010648, partial [Dionaea muscipula]